MDDPAEVVVANKIRAAFADVMYPGDENIVRAEEVCHPEWNEVEQAFKGKHWGQLRVDFLHYHYDALYVFTPEAYRYYLPAYMLNSILYNEESDIVPATVIYSLTPREDPKDLDDFNDRIGGFTPLQREAVKSFLAYLRMSYPDEYDEEVDEAIVHFES